MKDFEFIIVTPPNEECIESFHKTLAQGLINKYGIEIMRKVVELSKTQDIK